MFGKLFKRSSSHRPKWYTWIIDLFIVFIGVYLAFLLNNYSESQKNANQRIKVLSSLKLELEQFRCRMPDYVKFQENKIVEWSSALQNDSIIDFYYYLFIQPQYDYTALEYAININEVEVIDYELFTVLRVLFNNIKSLEFAENKMTMVADQFRNTASFVSKNSMEYKARIADNHFYFLRFINYAKVRGGSMKSIVDHSIRALTIINEKMDQNTRKKIEYDLLIKYFKSLNQAPSKKEISAGIKQFFPHFTQEDQNAIINEFNQTN